MNTAVYDVHVGEQVHTVAIDADGRVTLGGIPHEADIRRIDATAFSVLLNGRSFVFHLAPVNGGYAAGVDGTVVAVTVETDRSRLLRKFASAGMDRSRTTSITAPMPALVVRIEVEPDQEVKEGQGLVVLEAMKMENEIKSPCNGVVKQIHVLHGKAVEKGEILVTLE